MICRAHQLHIIAGLLNQMEIVNFVAWYIALSILGMIAFPILSKLFRRFPDKGYAFSRTAGLLLVTYLFWLMTSLGLAMNSVGGILSGVIILILSSLWIYRNESIQETYIWIKDHWKYAISIEILFVLSFASMTGVRAYNPDIFGTEKPMELMFINSILASPTFPPHDAWLSQHAISYYYFGYVMVAMLARITGTPSSIAFNLGLSTLFALTAVGGTGVCANIISYTDSKIGDKAVSLFRSFFPSLLAPVFILIIGNLYGVLEILHNNGMFWNTKVPAIYYDYGLDPAEAKPSAPPGGQAEPAIGAGLINLWDWLDLKRLNRQVFVDGTEFDWRSHNWFFASRVIHDRNLVGVETEAIDEFPAFSFLLGDMHPHVLSPLRRICGCTSVQLVAYWHGRHLLHPKCGLHR